LTRILTFLIFVKKYKTAHTKSQLSQQPSMLGIKIGDVLKLENQAEQLLFFANSEKNYFKNCILPLSKQNELGG